MSRKLPSLLQVAVELKLKVYVFVEHGRDLHKKLAASRCIVSDRKSKTVLPRSPINDRADEPQ